MIEGIFNKYFEAGLAPIPTKPNKKAPDISHNWQRYCTERPSQSDIDAWDELSQHTGIGIGITCGPASGVIGLDIDTDDESVRRLLPLSPVIKVGKPGRETRFFRYTENVKNRSFKGVLDILSLGKQTLVPPTIHPTTGKPYIWKTPDTLLDYPVSELPELDLSFVPKLERLLKRKPLPTDCGRNNFLVKMITAMRAEGKSRAKIISDVYKYDKLHFSPRLFTDPLEQFRATTEEEVKIAVGKLIDSVTRTLVKAGIISKDCDEIVDIEFKPKENKKRTLPPLTGTLKVIFDYIYKSMPTKMPDIAYAGAVSFIGAVACNRFRLKETWPNNYLTIISPTGTGKSYPKKFADKMNQAIPTLNIKGRGGYHGEGGITKGLKEQRERLDIIDEAGILYQRMNSHQIHSQGMVDVLCSLWSQSSGTFDATEYAKDESKALTRSCYNPCVNQLNSTTPSGFAAGVSSMLISKGLIPRTLFFIYEQIYDDKEPEIDEELFDEARRAVLEILKQEKVRATDAAFYDALGERYQPRDLYHPGIRAALNEVRADYHNDIRSLPIDSILSMMKTRAAEHVNKLAIIKCVSDHRTEVSIDDLQFAKSLFDAQLENVAPFLLEASAGSDWEKDVAFVESLLRKRGYLRDQELKKTAGRKMTLRRLQEVTDLLEDSGSLWYGESTNQRGPKTEGWHWLVED